MSTGSGVMPGGGVPSREPPTNDGGARKDSVVGRIVAPTGGCPRRSAFSGAPRPTLLKPGSATCCATADDTHNAAATAVTRILILFIPQDRASGRRRRRGPL